MTNEFPPGVMFKCGSGSQEVHVSELDLTEGLPVVPKIERERMTQHATRTLAIGASHHAEEKSERVSDDFSPGATAKTRRSASGARTSQQAPDQTSDQSQ
jgi:hypothetical protein